METVPRDAKPMQRNVSLQSMLKSGARVCVCGNGKGHASRTNCSIFFVCSDTDAEQISLQCTACLHEQAIISGREQSSLKHS